MFYRGFLEKKHHISEFFNNNNNDQSDNLLAISQVQVQSQVSNSIDDTEMIIQVDSNLKSTTNEEQIVSDTQFEDVKYYFGFIFFFDYFNF